MKLEVTHAKPIMCLRNRRLIPSNKLPESTVANCPIRWFKADGNGRYRCVDGGSGEDARNCFKAYDVTGVKR